MGRPTEEQAIGIQKRVALLLEEWDDAQFALIVLCDNGNFINVVRATPMNKIVFARGLLDEGIADFRKEEEEDT